MPGVGLVSRVARRALPRLFKQGSKITRESLESQVIPFRTALKNHGGEAGRLIGDGVLNSRNISRQAHGEYLANIEPIIKNFTPDEALQLSRGLQGEAVAGRPAGLIQGLRPLLEATGQTPQSIIQGIISRGTKIPQTTLANGRRLLQLMVTAHEDDLTRALIRRDINPIVDQLQDPGLKGLAQAGINNVLNHAGGSGPLSTLRAFNTATLLGRAVILNASQPVLSTVSAGMRPFLKELQSVVFRQGRKEAKDFALRIGEALDGALTDYIRHDLAPGKLQRFGTRLLRHTGFLAVERFNRRFAAGIGRQWFFDLARKAKLGDELALKQLKRFGVNPSKGLAGRLTDTDLKRFAQSFVRETQFRITPEELPIAASNEWWRSAMQFKTFSLKATELMLNEIETRGLPQFLSRAIPLAATAGVLPLALRRATAGRAPIREDESAGQFLLEAMFSIGIGALPFDAIEAASRGRFSDFILGPTGALVADVAQGGISALRGNIQPLAESVASRIPVVGPAARRGVRRQFQKPPRPGRATRP